VEQPDSDALLRAFAAILRQRLMHRESVEIPGLGTFDVQHEASRVRQGDDGGRALLPPRDLLTFEPDEG